LRLANREKILIVEDDPAVSTALQIRLNSAGYQARVASEGKTAIKEAALDPPDLVILDVKLPDMDGYEVCRTLRKQYQPWELPVVVLTGMDDVKTKLDGFATGADAFLTKPCRPGELLKTVRLLLGQENVN
jgi:DNA-binding response OmpR family regulator